MTAPHEIAAVRIGRRALIGKTSEYATVRSRRRAFIRAYLADPTRNATAAALAAGYSKRSAKSTASELLKDPRIQAAIEAATAPMRHRYRLTQKRVLAELATNVFSDLADYRVRGGRVMLAPGAQPRATRAVAGVKRKTRYVKNASGGYDREHEIEFRLWDKTKALGLAMKHLGLLVDRVEIKDMTPQSWVIGGHRLDF